MSGPKDGPRFLLDPPIETRDHEAPVLLPPTTPVAPPPPMAKEPAAEVAEPSPLWPIAVSDNDRLVAAGHETGAISLWQPAIAQRLGMTAAWLVARGHTRAVRALAFEPPMGRDYTVLVSGAVDGTIGTWHLGDRRQNAMLAYHDSSVLGLAFDARGARLVSCSEDRTIAVASWPDGKVEKRWKAHSESVLCVAVSPDGERIASGGNDEAVYLWSIKGERLARIDDGKAAFGAQWNVQFVDDERVVMASFGRIVEWTQRGGCRTLWTAKDPIYQVYGLAVRADRAEIAFAWKTTAYTLDLASGAVTRRADADIGDINGVAYLGDNRIACAGTGGRAVIWGDDADAPDVELRGVRA